MEKLQENAHKIRVPTNANKVYKDECMLSFDSPDSPDGLYVCMNTFYGFGKEYVDEYSKNSSNFVFLHRKRTKKEITVEKECEPDKKIARLAIGVEGGFDPSAGSKKYEFSTELSIVILPEHKVIASTDEGLPENVRKSISAIESAEDAVHKFVSQVTDSSAWDGEARVISTCAENLMQLDNGVKIPPKGWKCSKCDLTENLWLNLTDGSVLCGRKQYDGSGGNNHAVDHFKEVSYPLAVKLGTITPDGKADVFSYIEDDMVVDPHLVAHLAHFGINVKQMEKTDKTMAELEIDYNQRVWEYSRLTESGQKLVPVFGPGFTGLKNLGNSCYVNSVLQVLFTVPSYIQRYFDSRALWSKNIKDIPEDLESQMTKLANGLLSGKYSKEPSGFDSSSASSDDIDDLQPGVAPTILRSLVGRGHYDFSTKKQQDAVLYLQHLLKLEERSSVRTNVPSAGHCFKFDVEDKFVCGLTQSVKLVKRGGGEMHLPLPVPMELTTNQAEVDAFKERKAQSEAKGETFSEDLVRAKVPFEACLSKFIAPEIMNLYSSAAKSKVDMAKSTRLLTFPDFLFIQLLKFGMTEQWEPVKKDVSVSMPETLDLSALKSRGLIEGETLMPEEQEEQNKEPEVDEAVVQTIVDMGFDRVGCRKAVQLTGGNLEEAVNWVMQHFSDPDFAMPLQTNKQSGDGNPFNADPEALMMLESMGFTAPQAKLALKETQNNLERAADWLFSHQPDLDQLVAGAEGSGEASTAPKTTAMTDGEPKYELVGFISHMGTSIHVGHYVCHIKKDGQWTIFNDNKVSKSVEPPLDLGYLYLYRRVSN